MDAATHARYDTLLDKLESAAVAWTLPGIGQTRTEQNVPLWRQSVLANANRSVDAHSIDRMVSA
jgi:hypothetical protein